MSGWIGKVADLWKKQKIISASRFATHRRQHRQASAASRAITWPRTFCRSRFAGYKNLSQQDVGTLAPKAMSAVGVNPAPRYISQTSLERATEAYWKDHRDEGGIKPEQMESKKEKNARSWRASSTGDDPGISKALASGAIKARDIKTACFTTRVDGRPWRRNSCTCRCPMRRRSFYERANLTEAEINWRRLWRRRERTKARAGRAAFTGF